MSASLQETYDSLSIILDNEETFNRVVDTVFSNLDQNQNGALDVKEMHDFIVVCCGEMGVKDPPSHEQVLHVFKHLDLDNDNNVSKSELAVFLRHLFSEQLKHTADKLKITPKK